MADDLDMNGLELLKEAGLDTEAGTGYTGGEAKYISAVQRFYKNHDKNRTKVEGYLRAGDYEDYAVTVHALKSNSRMIGASGLGDLFEELELAAKAGDKAVTEEKTEPALAAYDSLIEKLRPVGEMERRPAEGEIGAEEARDVLGRLLEALDDFDDELSKELAVKLSGYPFRLTQKNRLAEAIGFIDDFRYDEAAEIIKEIGGSIE